MSRTTGTMRATASSPYARTACGGVPGNARSRVGPPPDQHRPTVGRAAAFANHRPDAAPPCTTPPALRGPATSCMERRRAPALPSATALSSRTEKMLSWRCANHREYSSCARQREGGGMGLGCELGWWNAWVGSQSICLQSRRQSGEPGSVCRGTARKRQAGRDEGAFAGRRAGPDRQRQPRAGRRQRAQRFASPEVTPPPLVGCHARQAEQGWPLPHKLPTLSTSRDSSGKAVTQRPHARQAASRTCTTARTAPSSRGSARQPHGPAALAATRVQIGPAGVHGAAAGGHPACAAHRPAGVLEAQDQRAQQAGHKGRYRRLVHLQGAAGGRASAHFGQTCPGRQGPSSRSSGVLVEKRGAGMGPRGDASGLSAKL